jgi:hypothetical protein
MEKADNMQNQMHSTSTEMKTQVLLKKLPKIKRHRNTVFLDRFTSSFEADKGRISELEEVPTEVSQIETQSQR